MTSKKIELTSNIFPKNPFEDIKPTDFNKLNKKQVTEDFVEENFKNLGWSVFKPFHDTGIDRLIIKSVCPKGHTKIDENLLGEPCPVCKSKSMEIMRFIQVKTRQLKDNVFGFTLKSKDIRVDPRHVYLLYSDKTTESKQDFLMVSIKQYLEFFDNNLINPFSATSFRKGNNKLNSLKYNPTSDTWKWNSYDWEPFRNISGLQRIQDPITDLNLNKEIEETRKLADKLQKKFSKGNSYTQETSDLINKELKEKLELYNSKEEIIKLRKSIEQYLQDNCDIETIASMKRYFEFIKTIETIGGDDSDE